MKLSNQPLVEGAPVRFTLSGFPVDENIVASLERFYSFAGAHISHSFEIFNTFEEKIFTGSIGSDGRVASLNISDRQKKMEPKPE